MTTNKKVAKKAAPKEEKQEAPEYIALNPELVAKAAEAGLLILQHDQCMIPNRVRAHVEGLERILAGLLNGGLQVVAKAQKAEE
jgi:hypothetical protein